MGLLLTDVQLFASLVKAGIKLGDLATLGRQFLLVDHDACERALRGLPIDREKVDQFLQTYSKWADDLYVLLGARTVTAIDFSAYEGAGVLHDMNLPIGPDLYEKFDTVHDGGTLEHVFNFPVALSNIILMTRVGGRIILNKPANNQCGHGFYQFSPELFYRAFSEENGFAVEVLTFAEVFRNALSEGPFYDAADPKTVGARVEVDGGYPTNLLVVARKMRHVIPFSTAPMQSDYAAAWKPGDGSGAAGKVGMKLRLLQILDRRMPRLIQASRSLSNPLARSRFFSKRDLPFFQKVDAPIIGIPEKSQ